MVIDGPSSVPRCIALLAHQKRIPVTPSDGPNCDTHLSEQIRIQLRQALFEAMAYVDLVVWSPSHQNRNIRISEPLNYKDLHQVT